jgi:hypothetical protein
MEKKENVTKLKWSIFQYGYYHLICFSENDPTFLVCIIIYAGDLQVPLCGTRYCYTTHSSAGFLRAGGFRDANNI